MGIGCKHTMRRSYQKFRLQRNLQSISAPGGSHPFPHLWFTELHAPLSIITLPPCPWQDELQAEEKKKWTKKGEMTAPLPPPRRPHNQITGQTVGQGDFCPLPGLLCLAGGPPPAVPVAAFLKRQKPTGGAIPELISTDLKFRPKHVLFESDTCWPPNLSTFYSLKARFCYLVQLSLHQESSVSLRVAFELLLVFSELMCSLSLFSWGILYYWSTHI